MTIHRILAGAAALLFLSACQSVSMPSVSVPTGLFSGGASDACPDLKAGPGPFVPPFPTDCATMNRTASGVRYIPITNGDILGGSPSADATIVVNYQAFLAASGQEIDSSYARGESSVYKVSDLIDGWGEAIRLMNPGDEWLVFVPAAEAFGAEPLGQMIPANSDLVYRVQLEGFLSALALAEASDAPPPPARGPDMAAWRAFLPWDPMHEAVTTLESGVSIVLLEEGAGTRRPQVGEQVRIHYEGRLAETSDFFDSSWSRGEPTVFTVGSLVPGFNEALQLMVPGDRVLVHLPADQAYGDRAVGEDIPAGSDLMFQINLIEIVG